IGADYVAAVQITHGLKGHQVTAGDHVMIQEAGGIDEALKSLLEPLDLEGVTCAVSIPGEHVSYRNFQMPFRDKKKIRQTLVFELETMVPVPAEDLIVDFTMVDRSDQSEILAASVKREDVSKYLAHLQAHGVDPEVMDVGCVPTLSWLLNQGGIPDDGLLLDFGHSKNTMLLFLNRRLALIRTFPFEGSTMQEAGLNETESGFASTESAKEIEESHLGFLCTQVQNTLHAFASQTANTVRPERVFVTGIATSHADIENTLSKLLELPVETIQVTGDPKINLDPNIAQEWNPLFMDNALALAVGEARPKLGFNFRREEFEVNKVYFGRVKGLGKIATVLAAILLLVGVDLGIDYFSLRNQYRTLDQQITEVFKRTLPDVKRIVNPVAQMGAEINALKKTASSVPGIGTGTRVLDLLREFSMRVPESADIHVARIVVDPDMVQIKGDTDTFNTVDTIKKGLEPSSYFSDVIISSANLDRSGNRVQFEMKLGRAK
ncbi:MAG: pilus assembly protein PilM, partial [Deltaproteobacteria bacterium]|nr:pilus assembly protein PilM [Deltaproteobacteria bacterium]